MGEVVQADSQHIVTATAARLKTLGIVAALPDAYCAGIFRDAATGIKMHGAADASLSYAVASRTRSATLPSPVALLPCSS
jgi:hypothetical protein